MRTAWIDGIAGVLLGALGAVCALTLGSPAAGLPGEVRYHLGVRGEADCLALDSKLRLIGRMEQPGLPGFVAGPVAGRGVGIPMARGAAHGQCAHHSAVPTIEARGRIRWPDGSLTPAPFGDSLAIAASGKGDLLIAGGGGRLALRDDRADRGVLALGSVPGEIRDIAVGPRDRTWWVLLDLAGEEVSPGALAFLETRGEPRRGDCQILTRWMHTTNLDGPAILAPIPGLEAAWVIGQGLTRSAGRAVRVGADRGADSESLRGRGLQLPLLAARAAVATAEGGLVVAFPGAVVSWDRFGQLRRSRGGLDDAIHLTHAPPKGVRGP